MKSDLSSIKVGESAVVKAIEAGNLSGKLAEMGLFNGRLIKVLYKAPFGDPIAIDIGGYVLSLRRDEARIVAVEKVAV